MFYQWKRIWLKIYHGESFFKLTESHNSNFQYLSLLWYSHRLPHSVIEHQCFMFPSSIFPHVVLDTVPLQSLAIDQWLLQNQASFCQCHPVTGLHPAECNKFQNPIKAKPHWYPGFPSWSWANSCIHALPPSRRAHTKALHFSCDSCPCNISVRNLTELSLDN